MSYPYMPTAMCAGAGGNVRHVRPVQLGGLAGPASHPTAIMTNMFEYIRLTEAKQPIFRDAWKPGYSLCMILSSGMGALLGGHLLVTIKRMNFL